MADRRRRDERARQLELGKPAPPAPRSPFLASGRRDRFAPRPSSGPPPIQLTAAEREDFEERAAIIHFDGGMSIPEAERQAHDAVIRARRSA